MSRLVEVVPWMAVSLSNLEECVLWCWELMLKGERSADTWLSKGYLDLQRAKLGLWVLRTNLHVLMEEFLLLSYAFGRIIHLMMPRNGN